MTVILNYFFITNRLSDLKVDDDAWDGVRDFLWAALGGFTFGGWVTSTAVGGRDTNLTFAGSTSVADCRLLSDPTNPLSVPLSMKLWSYCAVNSMDLELWMHYNLSYNALLCHCYSILNESWYNTYLQNKLRNSFQSMDSINSIENQNLHQNLTVTGSKWTFKLTNISDQQIIGHMCFLW